MADKEDDLLSALIDTFDSDDDCENETLVSEENKDKKDNPCVQSVSSTNEVSNADSAPVSSSGRPVSAQRVLEECNIFLPTVDDNKNSLTKELFGDGDSDLEEDELITKTSLSANGQELSNLLKNREQQTMTSSGFYDNKLTTNQIKNKWARGTRTAHSVDDSQGDRIPLLGLGIVNPKVSMDFLKKSFETKELVHLCKVGSKKAAADNDKDWITIGVIASKSDTKRSNAGKDYIIFRLADMSSVDDEITLFLFGPSYSAHWKLPVGTTIGLMNPAIMDNDKSKNRCVATINISNQSQLMVIGTSKDFGTCGSVTKNGNKCTNIVNKSSCSRCRFHTMQEHKAQSHRRAELNTAYGGREPSSVSRNRLMSKLSTTKSSDDCFIYGGQSFSSKAKTKTNVSLKGVLNRSAQKGNLQSTLNLYQIKAEDQTRIASAQSVARNKADERLEELISRPTTATMQFMKHLVSKELNGGKSKNEMGVTIASVKPGTLLRQEKERLLKSFKEKKQQAQAQVSKPGADMISLDDMSIGKRAKAMTADAYRQMVAKKNAIAVVRKNGAIEKEDVNVLRKKLTDKQKEQIKRKVDDSLTTTSRSETGSCSTSATDVQKEKRRKMEKIDMKSRKLEKIDVNSEAYLAIRNKKSINSHLVQQVQDERESQYFNVLEKKESYETKLLGTHMIESTLFLCLQCDYQDWKLADRCYTDKHKYKKLQALKKFFKCNSCKERVATHEKFPTNSCKKCGTRSFSKAGMINEKKVTLAGQDLSLRGNEEANLGSFDKINLDIH